MKRSAAIAMIILAGCVLVSVGLIVIALAFSMGRASVAGPAAQTSAQTAAARSDPRCAPLLAGDDGVVNSAHGASWTSFASGAVTGVVAIPVYVTRAFDPQADGYMEIVAADPDTRASFAMIAPASAVDARVLRGGLIFPRFGGRPDYAASAATLDFNSNSMGLARPLFECLLTGL